MPIAQIENSYSANNFSRVNPGDIRGFADGCRYLLESAARISAIVVGQTWEDTNLSRLLKRLDLGVPEEMLELADLGAGLTRNEFLALSQAGIRNLREASLSSEAVLRECIGPKGRKLYQSLREGDNAEIGA